MYWVYNLHGGSPFVKKLQIDGATTVIQGVPIQSSGEDADNDGVVVVGETTCVGGLGISTDTATSTNALSGTSADNAGFLSCIINPDAVFAAKLTEGATEDTALVLCSEAQAASSDGLTITGGTDEFVVWGYSGANRGHVRRFESSATLVKAMPQPILALDEFLETTTVPYEATQWPTLSTLLTQVQADKAVDADSDNFTVVEQWLRDETQDGKNNSYTLLTAADHAFRQIGVLQS
jgi:hypothetical protein